MLGVVLRLSLGLDVLAFEGDVVLDPLSSHVFLGHSLREKCFVRRWTGLGSGAVGTVLSEVVAQAPA